MLMTKISSILWGGGLDKGGLRQRVIRYFMIYLYRAFEKVCPNTLILLNEIERLKLKNEKLGSKLITLSSKNIFGHS